MSIVDNFPQFLIIEIIIENGSTIVTGKLSKTTYGKSEWISDGRVGCLMYNRIISFGSWKKSEDLWKFIFEPEEADNIVLTVGEELYAIERYWGERIYLVFDETILWVAERFEPKSEHDHSHCSICWATISRNENINYYNGNGIYPVCNNCYNGFIIKKNIDFLTG